MLMSNSSLRMYLNSSAVSDSALVWGSDSAVSYLAKNEETQPGYGEQVGSHSTGTSLHGGR